MVQQNQRDGIYNDGNHTPRTCGTLFEGLLGNKELGQFETTEKSQSLIFNKE